MRYREAKKIQVGDNVRVKYPPRMGGSTNVVVTSILDTGYTIFFDGNGEERTCHPNHHRVKYIRSAMIKR